MIQPLLTATIMPWFESEFSGFFNLEIGNYMATKTITMPRDAKTGRIVSPQYAKDHRSTTTVEHRKVTTPPPQKKK